MSVLVGKQAPNFFATAVVNGSEIVSNFSLNKYIDKNYVILFFYPKNFTFVCPTELHAFQEKLEEFKSRNCEIVACSTDTAESHVAYLRMPKNQGGIQGITYPVIADTAKSISSVFDVLPETYDYDEEGNIYSDNDLAPYRGLFLIDKEGIVQHQIVNNKPLGRNVDEAIRLLDALIQVETNGVVCPANWSKGDETINETPESVADYLAKS